MDLTRPRFSDATVSAVAARSPETTRLTKPGVTRRITPEELAAQDKDRPWFVVRGEVYDGTPFLKEHPGGADSILLVAGDDATEDFTAIHSADAHAKLAEVHQVGTHDTSDADAMFQYHIGTLVGSVPPTPAVDDNPPAAFLDPKRWKRAKLTEVTRVNHDSCTFRFALEREGQPLGLPVGQHVFVRLRRKDTGELVQRAYTPVSMQDAVGVIDFLIK